MPRVRLSKSIIDDLPSGPKDTVYWDAGLPGFGVKVTPKGRKVFIVLYRVAGAGSRLRKYTIGLYGKVTLAMARAQAQKICERACPSAAAGRHELRRSRRPVRAQGGAGHAIPAGGHCQDLQADAERAAGAADLR